MARFLKDRSKKIGAAPGAPVFVGKQKVERPIIHLMDYTRAEIQEAHYEDAESLEGLVDTETHSWINVYGLHDTELIQKIGKQFGLHNLLIEDVLNTGQRPTFIDYDDYFFIAVKMLKYDPEKDYVHSEQLSIVVGKNYLLTFQEVKGDVFTSIRDRLRKESVPDKHVVAGLRLLASDEGVSNIGISLDEE